MREYPSQKIESVPGMSSLPEPTVARYVCGKCGGDGSSDWSTAGKFRSIVELWRHYEMCDPVETLLSQMLAGGKSYDGD